MRTVTIRVCGLTDDPMTIVVPVASELTGIEVASELGRLTGEAIRDLLLLDGVEAG